MKQPPLVILESFSADTDTASYIFSDLAEEVEACSLDEVLPSLRKIEAEVAGGLHAAGFISYEAAPAINPELVTRPQGEQPLLWFGLFRKRLPVAAEIVASRGDYRLGEWHSELDEAGHSAAVDAIHNLIANGDTYQVNLTMRLRSTLKGEPFACYRDLCRAQRPAFSAYMDIGRWQILSASPELFFSRKGGVVTTRPMKGTISRGRWSEEDLKRQDTLQNSQKERAENLMIVDLLRNDLGMVARTGRVKVESLFDIETLPTLHQMTSTVTARVEDHLGLTELLAAIFPCGSVTGAPKRRTMEIIRELEKSPRGIYTGCIGYLSPGTKKSPPESIFSVAIRTMVVDSSNGSVELGVGSGITWDAMADSEYAECLAKGEFTRSPAREFHLIESILYVEGSGYYLLQRHMERIKGSAKYFGFHFDPDAAGRLLENFAKTLHGRHKVRFLLYRDGKMELDSQEILPDPGDVAGKVAFAGIAVESGDPFLYHKTSCRNIYSSELAKQPDCLDIIFCNEKGEVCEGANHNLVARTDNRMVTPPLASGLLPGVMRGYLLESGEICEQVITRGELENAEEIWLINSVRGWRRVSLVA